MDANHGMIKTIIFDLGKVIIPFDFKIGYARLAPLCGYPAEEIPQRLRATDLVMRFEEGQIESEPFVREMGKILGFDPNYAEFRDIWSSIFAKETIIPEAVIAGLHARYRLVLLSNTNAIHFEMVRDHYPLLNHFDEHILSYKVGACKPSPKIFHAALAAAQCEPAECFYTDDILEYIHAARGHGIDAVQFESLAQLERELKARDIAW